MRFLSLDLTRYGHFTGRTVEFRPDAALHIVYGPNEAGKSSALAAFSDLLFGFPDRKVGYDFLHQARDLRLGATLRARSGAELAFRRRKGRSNTLLDAATEAALNDDALAAFVGSLDRGVFERAFGLNSERLRAGAYEMLADDGEIGQMLFSAASGLTGLRATSEALASEADGIYRPRARSTAFNQAIDRYDEARKAERDRQLNASDWNAILKEERDLEQEFSAVEQRQLQRQRRIGELERLQRLRGFLLEIDGYEAALSAFCEIEPVEDGVGTELAELETARDRLAEAVAAKDKRLVTARADLDALVIDDALLSQRREIGRLQRESGLYEQALDIVPRRKHELRDAETGLVDAAGQFGFGSIEDLEKSFPGNVLRAEFEALVEEMKEHARNRRAADASLEENRAALTRLEQRYGEGHVRDPAPLRQSHEALRDDLTGIREAEALETEIADRSRALLDGAARLRPVVTDILSLDRRALPDEESLSAARDRLATRQAAVTASQEALLSLDETCERLEALLAQDRETGPVPTRAAIDTARKKRDGLFAKLAGGGDVGVYHDAVRTADDLADGALDDAERVARHADNLDRLEHARAERRHAQEQRDAAAASLVTAKADYEALFQPLAVQPRAPEAMIEWLRRVEGLLEDRATLASVKDRKRILDRRNEALRAALERLAGSLGAEAGLPLEALAREVNTALIRLGERWAEAREHEGALKAARQAIEKGDEHVRLLQVRDLELTARFERSLPALGLSGDVGLAGADAALTLWARLPSLLAARARLAQELAADQARIAAFEAGARQLADAVAGDLAGEPASRIVHRLTERVADHGERAAQRTTLMQNAQLLQQERESDRSDLEAVEARIADIAAGLPVGVAIEGLSQRLRQRSAARQSLSDARQRFSGFSEGATEAEIRALAETLDDAHCRQELARLKADDEEDKVEIETLRERRTAVRHRKQALEAGGGSEAAAFDRVSAEAEARALARQWVVLKLAGRLLDGALERYREGRADPILAAAGRHFKTLTRDTFEGLSQVYGEHDALVLSAVRAGGGELGVDALSDGTRDQLYLALRLAFLEDYANRNEPAPLIVDDIFQTFDDERSAAGLRALAGLGELQTILFTHEASMVDIARKELGSAADIVTLER